jgi:RNA polymerase sigma-70 factor, ECF subfamily
MLSRVKLASGSSSKSFKSGEPAQPEPGTVVEAPQLDGNLPSDSEPGTEEGAFMTRAEERELIERAIAGDRDAAAACIRAHQASLYAYMLRISGRPEVAEDIVQDAFVRALTNLHRFDFKFRFSTWLFTIAKRLYVNAMQKHKPAYDSDVVDSAEFRGENRPERPAIDSELSVNAKQAIDVALASLGEDQREIVVLFHQLDWSIGQIAEHMDMPEGTIKSHLHRGRQKMRSVLAQHTELQRYCEELLAEA